MPNLTNALPSKRVVFVGHVDHGKSTLVGRMLYETGALAESKVESVKAVSARRGKEVEWAFLLDSFQAERDQGITIDVSQIFFRSERCNYVIIDAPGHKEFLKNMVTGAAAADAAVLIVDAFEGVREQSRRHAYLLTLLGLNQVVVAVTKMDLVDFSQDRFAEIEAEIREYLGGLGISPLEVIPVSAQTGDGVAGPTPSMPWYQGRHVLQALDEVVAPAKPAQLPLRVPVQDVYKFDQRRIIAGQVESGILRVGDEVTFSPSNKTARVESIEAWSTPEAPMEARAGQAVGFTLDEQIFVERGEVASHAKDPPILTNVFRATVFWFSDTPMSEGQTYKLKLNTAEHEVTVQSIVRVLDTQTLRGSEGGEVGRHDVAELVLRSRAMLALDEARHAQATGRFVLVDDYEIAGGGIISMEGYPDQRDLVTVRATNVFEVEHGVTLDARAVRNGHGGGVLWFTGLSGAGKSTLAVDLERELFRKGYQVYVLDGDNVRHGLNANLSFSPEDRAENIRRVGEVAALFADAGFIVISAFISPYRADRRRAREAAGEKFHEIFVSADLAVCEERDPKGLYKKARAGKIADFTGISAPYEVPDAPEMVVDTAKVTPEEGVKALTDYVDRQFGLTTQKNQNKKKKVAVV